MKSLKLALIAGALALASSVAVAQTGPSANSVGAKVSKGGNTVGGTAGSAAAGGTSASTVGLGANSIGRNGTSTTVGGAGSAAAVNGKTRTDTKVRENPQMLRAQSKAKAWDGGTFAKSATNTRVQRDGDLTSRTMSIAHQPGGKAVISKSRVR